MKQFFIIVSLLASSLSFSQVSTTPKTAVADSGKIEFMLQAKKDTSNYAEAFRILTNQVKLNPRNAEYRYFLGYAIDRLNADDGKGMFQVKKQLTIKASEQFEEVNRLEPVYKGEIFISDPYSKLTAIWGSLAAAYLNRKLLDSAKWAFSEGRKRGGFIEPVLDFNRQLLNSCDKSAILVTTGDDITIPIWYLQTIENYRTDITVIDANLINTSWYTKYLKSERNLKLSFSDQVIDTINYIEWQPQQVTIANSSYTTQKFSWELRPTYLDSYILKGDRILLDVLHQNLYSRPFYFSSNSDSTNDLFLSPLMAGEGLVNRVIPEKIDWSTNVLTIHKNVYNYNIAKVQKDDILKSRNAVILLNAFRWCYFNNIYNLIEQSKYDKAKELIALMAERFKTDKLPFTSAEAEKYFADLFLKVDQNYR